MFNNNGRDAENELENLRTQIDLKTLMFFILLIVAASLLVIFNMSEPDSDNTPQPTETQAVHNSFRPTGVALRTQISWDGNFNEAYTLMPGQSCLTSKDIGFYPAHRPPECSSADVDLWVVRVTPEGASLFYNTRGQADTLFSATQDDRGFERNSQAALYRYEQLVSQYSLLPPGRYYVIVDLFQPDLYMPDRNVRVCGAALFREGEPDQTQLFNGCAEISVGGTAPQTVTLVSFTVDAENRLVESSIAHGETFTLSSSFYGKSR